MEKSQRWRSRIIKVRDGVLRHFLSLFWLLYIINSSKAVRMGIENALEFIYFHSLMILELHLWLNDPRAPSLTLFHTICNDLLPCLHTFFITSFFDPYSFFKINNFLKSLVYIYIYIYIFLPVNYSPTWFGHLPPPLISDPTIPNNHWKIFTLILANRTKAENSKWISSFHKAGEQQMQFLSLHLLLNMPRKGTPTLYLLCQFSKNFWQC